MTAPPEKRNTMRAAVVVACTFVSAACASSTTGGGRSPAATPHVSAPRLVGTISVNGGVTLNTGFSSKAEIDAGGTVTPAHARATCADFARGIQPDPAAFVAPTVQTTGDTTVYLSATVATGYHGAGAYTSGSNPALTGTLVYGSGMGAGQSGVFTVFRSAIGGSTTLTVAADGSGMLAFSNWGSDEYKGGQGTVDISGTVTWTCR